MRSQWLSGADEKHRCCDKARNGIFGLWLKHQDAEVRQVEKEIKEDNPLFGDTPW